MPSALTFPGVYIEELPSGVRTITGVATSVAAFVGWAPKGPTDRAELVLGFPDFERKFGGLHPESYLGSSVSQFFANGGQKAFIVRVVTTGATGTGANNAAASHQTLDDKLTITANSPGKWGDNYAIITKTRPAPDDTRFQLQVANVKDDPKGVVVESFENLSMAPTDKRYVVNVLASESSLITATVAGTPPATTPPQDTPRVAPPAADAGNLLPESRLTGGADGKVLAADTPDFVLALDPPSKTGGIYHLDRVDLFNLLCVPGMTNETELQNLQKFCRDRRAFLIADCASNATFGTLSTSGPLPALTGDNAINAAFYFPWVTAPDPLQENRPRDYPPCGFAAGLYARTDTTRGVWKAPAGTEASLVGVLGPKVPLTNNENGVLNPKAVNCIRALPVYGTVLWGARTLQGNDERGSEWKYIPVRRTALFIEETLYRALTWVVFEPNDEPLWAQIRLNVGAFMHDLFRQGAFQGSTPKDAYFVKCDKETTTQSDINRGIVNIIVGFAPLKPAEFVIVKIQQIAGEIQT
jgi:phage tail sheath protein FI